MNYHEIIMGIIEAFTNAINEKSNWGRKAAADLLREVLDSYPIHNPSNLVNSFLTNLEDKTSWGKNQLVVKFYHTIVNALLHELEAMSYQSHEEETAPVVEEPTAQAGPSNAPKYNTTGAMIVAAARKGWLRAKGDKAKACTKCKTNNAVCQFTDGKRTISKCYVCG